MILKSTQPLHLDPGPAEFAFELNVHCLVAIGVLKGHHHHVGSDKLRVAAEDIASYVNGDMPQFEGPSVCLSDNWIHEPEQRGDPRSEVSPPPKGWPCLSARRLTNRSHNEISRIAFSRCARRDFGPVPSFTRSVRPNEIRISDVANRECGTLPGVTTSATRGDRWELNPYLLLHRQMCLPRTPRTPYCFQRKERESNPQGRQAQPASNRVPSRAPSTHPNRMSGLVRVALPFFLPISSPTRI